MEEFFPNCDSLYCHCVYCRPPRPIRHSPCNLWIFLLSLLLHIHFSQALQWLSLASLSSAVPLNKKHTCETLHGLNQNQVRVCRRNIEHMESVRTGAHLAVIECQYQFKNRRWNCTMVDHVSIFGNTLRHGTREAAFVHAISAAGVAHRVTVDCSNGKLDKCGCDRSVRGESGKGFQWAGCSDNVHYGTLFSKKFVDAHDKRKKQPFERYLMNMHNNEAGRKIVAQNMRIQCKCHGVSGSCELKTCWRAMPTFRQVGNILREKFNGATEVKLVSDSNQRRSLSPINPSFKPHSSDDLVYIEESPDYCNRDNNSGTLGTTGRACNASSPGIDGCELLCCHRGYTTRREVRVERCHCKFHWCCHVMCKDCKRLVEVSTCN